MEALRSGRPGASRGRATRRPGCFASERRWASSFPRSRIALGRGAAQDHAEQALEGRVAERLALGELEGGEGREVVARREVDRGRVGLASSARSPRRPRRRGRCGPRPARSARTCARPRGSRAAGGSCRRRRRPRASRSGSGAPSRSSACRAGSCTSPRPKRSSTSSYDAAVGHRVRVHPRDVASGNVVAQLLLDGLRARPVVLERRERALGARERRALLVAAEVADGERVVRWYVSDDVAVRAAQHEAAPRAGHARREAAAVEEQDRLPLRGERRAQALDERAAEVRAGRRVARRRSRGRPRARAAAAGSRRARGARAA